MKSLALATLMTAAVSSRVEAGIDDSFLVPKEQLVAQVRTIALSSPVLPPGVPDPERARRTLEELVTSELRTLGFRVIDSSRHAQIWRANAERLGGIFDSVTGEADQTKLQTCRDYTGRELGRLHGADAVGDIIVQRGNLAEGSGEQVSWRGTTVRPDQVSIRGTWLAFLLRDLPGNPMYGVRRTLEWTEVHASQSHELRAEPELARPSTIQASVETVLFDLGRAVRSSRPVTAADDNDEAAGSERENPAAAAQTGPGMSAR
ncbi:MAG TPA: hypothetical protein VEL28_13345 [Candidatus Binatia bacterium]|nr:hypothetical protein [Candidatus Binatia bacterium]